MNHRYSKPLFDSPSIARRSRWPVLITAHSPPKSSTHQFPTIPIWKLESAVAPAGASAMFYSWCQRRSYSRGLSFPSAQLSSPRAVTVENLLVYRPSRTSAPARLSLPAAGRENWNSILWEVQAEGWSNLCLFLEARQ